MLEKLYGASPLRFADNSAPPSVGSPLWDDAVGLCWWHDGGGGVDPSYYVTQMDGLTHLRGGTMAYLTRWSLVYAQNTLDFYGINSYTWDSYYRFDKQVGALNSPPYSAAPGSNFYLFQYLCVDRWLLAFRYNDSSLRVTKVALDGSGGGIVEASISGIEGASGGTTFSRTNLPYIVWIITNGGTAIQYNLTTKTFLPETICYLPAHRAAWYSPRFNVFIVLFNDATLSVYAAAPLPDTLANPTAVPSLTRAQVNTVRTRLLGSNSEPCAGELVTWSLTAGSGELLTAQSTTDSNGYATAQYLAPMTGGTNPTIQAQVKF